MQAVRRMAVEGGGGMSEHTPGTWRTGKRAGEIIAEREHYAGRLIAEKVAENDRPLLIAAPDLLAACEGGGMQETGPELLDRAANLLDSIAPSTAMRVREKANLERAAIAKTRGQEAVPHAVP